MEPKTTKDMAKYVKNIKVAKNLSKSSPNSMDVSSLIILHINGNVVKKFQSSIFYGSLKNQVFPKTFQTGIRTVQIIE